MARDYASALAQGEHVVRMEPAFHWGLFFAGWALERLGRIGDAIASLKEAAKCSGESPVMVAGLGHALAAAQDRKAASRVIQTLQRQRGDKGLFGYEIALIHAGLGDAEAAFKWLELAIQERSGWIAYMHADPRLDSLHGDARFRGLIQARAS
jgi:tetratricopeptide (TPR) repeat protein